MVYKADLTQNPDVVKIPPMPVNMKPVDIGYNGIQVFVPIYSTPEEINKIVQEKLKKFGKNVRKN